MAPRRWMAVTLLLTLAAVGRIRGEKSCQTYVSDWIQGQKKEDAGRKQNIEKMLFFLHVPRTAGRSFRKCFLGKAFPPSKRCENSYQEVSINRTDPKCHLLSSHDDFSLLQRLPHETALLTQLRNPIQRVLSAYGFTLEVASRALLRSKLQKVGSVPKGSFMEKLGRVQTDRVWPWSVLLPWMRETLWTRTNGPGTEMEEGRSVKERTSQNFTVSLEEFLDHDLVHSSIHNNMMFQILGITPYSTLPNAGLLRECVAKDPVAGQMMYNLAEERLRKQFILSITENLRESAELIAFKLGRSLKGRAWKAGLGGRKSSHSAHEHDKLSGKSEEIQQAIQQGRQVGKLVDQLLQAQAKNEPAAHEQLLQLGARMEKERHSVAEINRHLTDSVKLLAGTVDKLKKKKDVPIDELGLRDPLMLERRSFGRSFLDCMDYQRNKAVDVSTKLFEKLQKKYGPALAEKLRLSTTARANIQLSTLEHIKTLNSWDMRLYDVAKKLFGEQVQRAKESPLYEVLPDISSTSSNSLAGWKPSQVRRSRVPPRSTGRRLRRTQQHGRKEPRPAE